MAYPISLLSDYPELPEHRRRWFDRLHFDIKEGQGIAPISQLGWVRGPKWVRAAIWTLGFMGSAKMRPFFELTRKKKNRLPKNVEETKFETPDLQEFTTSLPNSPTSAGSI